MNEKNTGPWYVGAQNDGLFIIAGAKPSTTNDYPNHDADREVIATINGYEPERACLIAAAPQLVEALRMIEECLNEGYEDATADALHHAREALRLANGE